MAARPGLLIFFIYLLNLAEVSIKISTATVMTMHIASDHSAIRLRPMEFLHLYHKRITSRDLSLLRYSHFSESVGRSMLGKLTMNVLLTSVARQIWIRALVGR